MRLALAGDGRPTRGWLLAVRVRWDLKEIRSEHSGYVDSLVSSFRVVITRLETLGEKRLPETANKAVVGELFSLINMAFVEGFVALRPWGLKRGVGKPCG